MADLILSAYSYKPITHSFPFGVEPLQYDINSNAWCHYRGWTTICVQVFIIAANLTCNRRVWMVVGVINSSICVKQKYHDATASMPYRRFSVLLSGRQILFGFSKQSCRFGSVYVSSDPSVLAAVNGECALVMSSSSFQFWHPLTYPDFSEPYSLNRKGQFGSIDNANINQNWFENA